MANSNLKLNLDFNNLTLGNVHIAVIQSLIIIATAFIYYSSNKFNSVLNNHHSELIAILICFAILPLAYLYKKSQINLKTWHLFVILCVFTFVFNYEINTHAQILDGIDGAIDGVGTAAGGSFAATVLDAVIDLIRIAVYIAVAGAVIAGIIYGVAQGQWQAPVLIVGVIISAGLFLEIMGAVVFG